MGNLIAILAHCGRGDECIMGDKAHTFLFEAGGVSALGGVFPHIIPNLADGTLDFDDIRMAIRVENVHHPHSRLLVLENTQNRCGGAVLTADYTQQASDLVHQAGLKVHLDGARIFNAAAALAVDVKTLVDPVDSVTFCLSKGLCAPVGSVLCGSGAFIAEALRLRKQLGGGMRQAGVLAAAGMIALEKMTKRLGEDHRRAMLLAEGLQQIDGITLPMGLPATNMVFIKVDAGLPISDSAFSYMLAEKSILIGNTGYRQYRLVLHNQIQENDVMQVIEVIKKLLSE